MKPSIPKGTRDFTPTEMVRRNYIFDSITTVFKRFGFQQIETPAMENITTLTGKYGKEGDQLLYKILNSRIHESKNKEQLSSEFSKALEKNTNSELLTERALRYDLTVPFARYVVMRQNEITFPFKRYQVQPVWRADRPQKGRYREFYQCDADVIGSTSLLNEVELIQMIYKVFALLGIKVILKFNNRKILSGLVEMTGNSSLNKFADFITILDKLDKIGIEKVNEELSVEGFAAIDLTRLTGILKAKNNLPETINVLKNFLTSSQIGLEGINEVEILTNYLSALNIDLSNFEFDVTLARGLNYYTGAIFEVKVNDPRSTFTSSILGGGRYDDLTGIFGLPNVSGVGISFGVDRIYDVMEEMKLFDALDLKSASTQVMFVNFGHDEEMYCLKLLAQLRQEGINAEMYPDQSKMKKQMAYADAKKIPFVILAGEEEIKSGLLGFRDMVTGSQEKLAFQAILTKLNHL